jgi:hypothetical protein
VLINETDLHQTVVRALREKWPQVVFTAGLGELQITSDQRIEAYKKGYMKGHPDLLIFNKTSEYAGLALEFKNPGNATARASEAQEKALGNLKELQWKTVVSNDYDEILLILARYLEDSKRSCDCCKK